MSQGVSTSRVAFFGGSFDPPHLGHLAVARAAREALELDTVLFAPVGAQPLKPVGATASFEDRVAMTKLAIAGEAGFAVSLADAPKARGVPNYTVEALENLKKELEPGCALFCLMGADSFVGLRHWHRAAEIPFVAPLIVASRPGEYLENVKAHLPAGLALEAAAGGSDLRACDVVVRRYSLMAENGRWAGKPAPFYLLPGVDVPISASRIRELLRIREAARAEVLTGPGDREVCGALLPAAVAEFVKSRGLYR